MIVYIRKFFYKNSLFKCSILKAFINKIFTFYQCIYIYIYIYIYILFKQILLSLTNKKFKKDLF